MRLPLPDRIYRRLLRVFPAEFRADFGDEMQEVFRDERDEAAREGGRLRMLALWCRTITGILRTAPREHADVLSQDVAYALRGMRRNPGFTMSVILTLALGIGVNTGVFGIVDAVIFRPLPVADPDSLLVLLEQRKESVNHNFSYADYVDFRDRNRVLSGLIAAAPIGVSLDEGGASTRVRGEIVSGDYFSVLGVSPYLGRTFLPHEDSVPGAVPVAVVSHSLWRRLFPGDRAVSGHTLTLNRVTFSIVGVMPDHFRGVSIGAAAEVWVPMMMQGVAAPSEGLDLLSQRSASWLTVIGRMGEGVDEGRATAGMQDVERQLAEETSRPAARTLLLAPGRQGDSPLPGTIRRPLMVLWAAVGFVLLIACANIANLQLARAAARRREIVVRLSIGAGRLRLVRQLVTESLVLALAGGACGLLVATWTSRVLLALLPSRGDTLVLDASLDARVLGFTLVLSLVTGLVFGLVPALHASRQDLARSLRDAGASEEPQRFGRLGYRQVLLVAEVALSLVLLVGAGLTFRTLQNLRGLDTGFDRRNLLLVSFDLETAGFDRVRGADFHTRLTGSVAAVPGVTSASLASVPPVNAGGSRMSVFVPGYRPRPDEDMELNLMIVDAGYFRTMGIPVLRGRGFDGSERPGGARMVVINETMAARYWPGDNPVGKVIGFGGGEGPFDTMVIGVVADAKYRSMRE